MGGPNNDIIPGGSYVRGNYPALDKALDEMGSPMPDRAVMEIKQTTLVDDRACPACHEVGVLRCHIESEPLGERVLAQWAQWECKRCGNRWPAMPDTCPPPRALVALSEDRQWMCSKIPEPFINFCICERVWHNGFFGVDGRDIWEERYCVEDTGQDAHAVLAAWLAGQQG